MAAQNLTSAGLPSPAVGAIVAAVGAAAEIRLKTGLLHQQGAVVVAVAGQAGVVAGADAAVAVVHAAADAGIEGIALGLGGAAHNVSLRKNHLRSRFFPS